jgi:hypothetical protein
MCDWSQEFSAHKFEKKQVFCQTVSRCRDNRLKNPTAGHASNELSNKSGSHNLVLQEN